MEARRKLPKGEMEAARVATTLEVLTMITRVTRPRRCPQRVQMRALEQHRQHGEMNSHKYTLARARLEFVSQLGEKPMQLVGAMLGERTVPWTAMRLAAYWNATSGVLAGGVPR